MVRLKNRYIVVELNDDVPRPPEFLTLTTGALNRAILDMVQRMHGDFGVGAIVAGFAAKYCNEKTRIAILRCRHGPHKLLASCLPIINRVDGKAIHLKTLYTGATIKQCFKFVQRYQQRKFDEFCLGVKSEEERETLKKIVMNFEPFLQMK